ncbi:MAG: class I SAM-dependent methyltransferase [Candidatus Hodarchaeales archaeon]|jgi:ubiquinone/menaquinone biosynthesis C-methylase UbiE
MKLPDGLAKSNAIVIKNHLEQISGGKILDVGTQSGDFISTLISTLKDYKSFIGIDISKKEWDQNRFDKRSVKFLEMNAEILEFEDSSFDTVCISHSIHHLSKIDEVMTEMMRVLKSNGYFILQECICDGEQTESQKTDVLSHSWDAKIDKLLGISHYKTLTKQKLKEIVTSLNLNEIKIIESTHSVKCLLCDDKFECDDPKNKNVVDFALKEIDDNLSRIQENLDKEILQQNLGVGRLIGEGDRLKERIKEYGASSASHLFCMGRKK